MSNRSAVAALLVLILLTSGVQPACGGHQGPRPVDRRATADTLRVLAYNIHHGEGMDEVLDLERIATLIRRVDPDLVALQEVDSVASRTNAIDQAAELGRLTDLEPVFGRFMPYQGGAYGMALLSRWPIAESRNLRLPDGAEPRTALSVRVTSPETGRDLRFVGIHLYRTDEERLAQAIRLEELLRGEPIPTVLAGDFNSRPGSQVMAHLAASWKVVEKGDDHFTFPSYGPDREIDFVLVRPADRFEVLGQQLLTEPVASDHRPVVVDLVIPGALTAQRTAASSLPVVTITGPTVIAFWEVPASDSALIADPLLASALDQQQYYWAETRDRLTALGVAALDRPGRQFQIRDEGRGLVFRAPGDSAVVGYLLVAPGREPLAIYRVQFPDELLARVRSFFGLPGTGVSPRRE